MEKRERREREREREKWGGTTRSGKGRGVYRVIRGICILGTMITGGITGELHTSYTRTRQKARPRDWIQLTRSFIIILLIIILLMLIIIINILL